LAQQAEAVINALAARARAVAAGLSRCAFSMATICLPPSIVSRNCGPTWAAPLPGKALVVLQPETGLATDAFLTPDGHAQERTLLDEVLARVQKRDVWIADRNFCTLKVFV